MLLLWTSIAFILGTPFIQKKILSKYQCKGIHPFMSKIHVYKNVEAQISEKNKYPRVQRCVQLFVWANLEDIVQVSLRLRGLEEVGSVLRSFEEFWDVLKKTLYGQTKGPTDRPTDQRMDKLSYRNAWTHLKTWPYIRILFIFKKNVHVSIWFGTILANLGALGHFKAKKCANCLSFFIQS